MVITTVSNTELGTVRFQNRQYDYAACRRIGIRIDQARRLRSRGFVKKIGSACLVAVARATGAQETLARNRSPVLLGTVQHSTNFCRANRLVAEPGDKRNRVWVLTPPGIHPPRGYGWGPRGPTGQVWARIRAALFIGVPYRLGEPARGGRGARECKFRAIRLTYFCST